MHSKPGGDNQLSNTPLPSRSVVPLVGAFAAFMTFCFLARAVSHPGPIPAFDAHYFASRHAASTPVGERFYVGVSAFGSPLAITVLGLIGAAWLARRRQWKLFAGWAIAFIGSGLIVQIAKRTLRHARPTGAEQFLHLSSYSFPSGHVVGSLVGFGMLAYVTGRLLPLARTTRAALYIIAAFIVAMIAWSRIYLGVHFVSDVVGAFAIGSAWLTVCIVGVEWTEQRRHAADVDADR